MAASYLLLLSFIFVFIADLAVRLSNTVTFLSAIAYPLMTILRFSSLVIILIISYRTTWRRHIPNLPLVVFSLLIIWNVITISRGFATAQTYFDFRFLVENIFALLVPFTIISAVRFEYSRSLIKFIAEKLFFYGFFLVPISMLLNPPLYPRAMIPISLILLFTPFFSRKNRKISYWVAALSVITHITYRANVLRIIVSALLVSCFKNRQWLKAIWLRLACVFLFFSPPLFLSLGASGLFNVFASNPFNINVSNSTSGEDENLGVDTRTFLYLEVLNSLRMDNAFLFGKGATGAYLSTISSADDSPTRYRSEVGFLNVLLHSGIVGVILYLLVFVLATYYGLLRSNNGLCKLLAVYISFRWALFFIEDVVSYDVNFYMLWFAIGLCLSRKFRSLDNEALYKYFSFR